jgi:hypothetical protein
MPSGKTVPFSVDEPLSVLDFPSSVHFHPGGNSTFDVTIANSVNVTN